MVRAQILTPDLSPCHMSQDMDEVIGIHLVMSLSKNTVYTNSFSLNNVMIEV